MPAEIREILPERAKNGEWTVRVRLDGTARYLHSRVDPFAEASRAFEASRRAPCVVLYGLGAGHLVKAALESPGTRRVFVVEPDPPFSDAVIELETVRALLSDFRVTPIFGLPPADSARTVLSLFDPLSEGGMETVPLQTRVALDPQAFRVFSLALARGLENAASEYSTWSRFGASWFRNALRNLVSVAANPSMAAPAPVSRDGALVLAAGPSIDAQWDEIGLKAASATVIACDTVWSAARERGVRVDAVVSIDCQPTTSRHFLSRPIRSEATLVADLSISQSALAAARADRVSFRVSTHPLHALAGKELGFLDRLDVSGGNVAHAACALAVSSGARSIDLYGADFCYPRGAAYARGSFLHAAFAGAQTRFSTLDGGFLALMLRSERAVPERSKDGGYRRIRLPLLDGYRELMESSIPEDMTFRAHGDGVPIRALGPPGRSIPPKRGGITGMPVREYVRRFLERLLDAYRGSGTEDFLEAANATANICRYALARAGRASEAKAFCMVETEKALDSLTS